MKKAAFGIVALVLFPALLIAQQGSNAQTPITTNQLTLSLADAPQPIASANVSLVGNPGHRTMYYWVVTEGVIGQSSPAGPFILFGAADTFSASAGAQITFAASNGVSYDVLRTTTPTPPTGACNCAIATALIYSLSVADASESLLSYTLAPVNASQNVAVIKNTSASAGLNQVSINGVPISYATLNTTTGSLGGSGLTAGACSSTTVVISGASIGQAVVVTPAADPGVGVWYYGFVSSSNTITVRVCAAVAMTPNATTYAVKLYRAGS
jgi:hypothetical protein